MRQFSGIAGAAERRACFVKEQSIWRTLAGDLIYDILGMTLFGVGIYVFARSSGIATGGFTGLGLIINHVTGLPVGAVTLLLNIPCILLSYRILGKMFLLRTVKTMVIQSVIMDLVAARLPVYTGDRLLAALCAGVLCGGGLVLVYMRGGSTGGGDFLTLSLRRLFPHLSIGQFNIVIDGCVLCLAGLVYGDIEATLYGLVYAFACTQVIDKVMYGAGSSKLAFIITEHGRETASVIGQELHRGGTLVPAIGTFSGRQKDLLLCACSRNQIFRVRKLAHKADPTALVMISQADEVFGEGFKKPE